MSTAAANSVIETYSTSFTLASALLPKRIRRDIRNLYAVVRIADEIVDGTAADAGVSDIAAVLDAYEQQVLAAPVSRFHTDPVLHAYAATARRADFDPAHVRAFFASMRRDTAQHAYSAEDYKEYIYGSAEVIGLLCLAVFIADTPVTDHERRELENGARHLGAAFQKVNFLRDYGEDSAMLGRTYFPHVQGSTLDDTTKSAIVADIRCDVGVARASISKLPRRVRPAVIAATDLFTELTERIDATPAHVLATTRINVPAHKKAALTARAIRSAFRKD